MSIASVGSLSNIVQIPHNCNTGLIRDLFLLLVQSLLLFLGILLTVGTMAEPIVVVGDSTATECSVLPEHTMVVVEPSTSNNIVAMVRTVVAVKNVFVAAMV